MRPRLPNVSFLQKPAPQLVKERCYASGTVTLPAVSVTFDSSPADHLIDSIDNFVLPGIFATENQVLATVLLASRYISDYTLLLPRRFLSSRGKGIIFPNNIDDPRALRPGILAGFMDK